MASDILQLADAIVTRLNSLDWNGTEFEARRSFAGCLDEQLVGQDVAGIKIDVIVPEEYDDIELITNGAVAKVATFGIVIRRKFASEDNDAYSGEVPTSQVDELIALGEVLALGTTWERLADYPDAAWDASEHSPIYRRDHLRELRQFTGAVALTFRVHADI